MFHLRMLPRRFIIVFTFAFALAFFLLLLTFHKSGVSPFPERLTDKLTKSAQKIRRPNLPKLYNPFSNDAHAPPEQLNSSVGDAHWFSDLEWLNPFSSSVTLDDDRALLPPQPVRTRIFTYYDSDGKDARTRDAENELVLAWRRAWWAQGFEPVVLNHHDAESNSMYGPLQHLDLERPIAKELDRWLAWEYMGGGILANWLVLPMAGHFNPLLVELRNGGFQRLTRFKGLTTGLYSGRRESVAGVIKRFMDDETLNKKAAFLDMLPRDTFRIDSRAQSSISFYDFPTIKSRYAPIADQLKETSPTSSRAEALSTLRALINAHLHQSWQESFPEGVAVLKPHPEHMTTLTSFAARIARALHSCPIYPESLVRPCPPTKSTHCRPCDPNKPMKLSVSASYINKPTVFTIGTAPHPFTFNSLLHLDKDITTRFVRRQTERDAWITAATSSLFQNVDFSGPQRLVRFKEAVASEAGAANSLWLSAERDEPLELEWIFGFQPGTADPRDPSHNLLEAESGTDPAGDESTRLDQAMLSGAAPSKADLEKEKRRMERAGEVVRAKDGAREAKLRDMVEAWNLADCEAWRFVKAWGARRAMERREWERVEGKYVGGEARGSKGGLLSGR